jgi:hypothetical protein
MSCETYEKQKFSYVVNKIQANSVSLLTDNIQHEFFFLATSPLNY